MTLERGAPASESDVPKSVPRSTVLEFAAPSGDPPIPVSETNDLSAEPFHLLVSCGPTDPDTHLPTRHERAAASVDPIQFA